MHLQQLLAECRRGKSKAQQQLYLEFADRFFLLCRRYTKRDAEAQEVLLGGFLKIYHSLEGFRYENDAAAIAWMKRIMVNECLMHLRKAQSFLQVIHSETLPEVHDTESALDNLAAEEIFTLITQLPIGYRTVFNLFVIEGLTHAEIAAALQISEGTSRSQLAKARALLQQMLIAKNKDYAWRKTK